MRREREQQGSKIERIGRESGSRDRGKSYPKLHLESASLEFEN